MHTSSLKQQNFDICHSKKIFLMCASSLKLQNVKIFYYKVSFLIRTIKRLEEDKETLESSFQGGILKLILKVANFWSYLSLNYKTLIRDFNENNYDTLNEFDPVEIWTHAHWIQRWTCYQYAIGDLMEEKEKYVD